MSVHARAPLRVDWAGGWTDVPVFAEREGGAVVNSAITLSVRVDCLLGGKKIRFRAEDLGERITAVSPLEISYDGKLDLHKAALNMLPVTGGIEILSRSDAPAGSGLGGSGALDVALLASLARCRRDDFDRVELAEMGFHLEATELHLLGGRQDQYAAALGGCHALSFDEGPVGIRRLAVDEPAARDLERHVVLAFTGHSHFSSKTHEHVWARYAAGEKKVAGALAALKELAAAAAEALDAGDWRRLASVVQRNWGEQQRLDATIGTPRTHAVTEAARGAGAWGSKATGAGAGGCVVILCAPGDRPAVTEAVTRVGARVLDFAFDLEGVTVWEGDEDVADDG